MKCPHCDGTGEIATTTGALILLRRKEAGLTQAQLAKAVGLSRTAITNIESGRHEVTVTKLVAMAKVLHCAPDALIPF